jgi:hypothetical protein
MRRRHRLVALGLVFVLTSIIGGCGSVPSWDPSDMLDFLDTKKKTPGDRKPVFPEGVPGLSQGVPKELIKGSPENQAAEGADVAVGQPVEAAPEPPPPAAHRSPKRSRRHSAPASSPDVAPNDQNVGEDTPPPKRSTARRPAAKRAPAATAPSSTQDAAPAQQQSNAPAFPAPLPSGSFSR